mmetsp:Transcript_30965/g.29576  ORF Transcript_30965/g.29576 Transcript_30965/m.29576 type:complete len:198 (-) Transcript_30965:45-638(-)|eukprot:CAMPEP_0119033714 /NCGR_PEP_ID=MMETSP1177-20130426/773_1 /TAXON_ID=2985 /ORGANISM="Ochromonas sp, Strain CCMP1899" /LENGTH=197 /DNA_ID=CAMNT_0006990665 /DNA_START=120 /DNA_END=713 /DNA_ORIENTATION=+
MSALIVSNSVNPVKALNFFAVVGKLKTLKRTGWVNNNVFEPESVADHMYRMSMLTFMLVDTDIKRDHLMKVCMIHDLAEALVGDITPYDGVSKEDKRKLEEDAMHKIVADLECQIIGNEILSLWLEYEEGTTKEAVLAHQLDKFEMITQAVEYEKSQGKKLDRFFSCYPDSFTHPEIFSWAKELVDQRNLNLDMDKA